ncbi:hypothetical protein P8452_33396 [Trifolium repens]|nr:hypothetical protein P8452_33396 [Trifolium repens]
MSTLLGHNSTPANSDAPPYENPEKHQEERNLLERSTKKKKDGDQTFSNFSSLPKDYREVMDMQAGERNGESYCDKVMGRKQGSRAEGDEDLVDEAEEEEDKEGMTVEERVIGDYECPEFIFSKGEEKRLYRPWKRGVIVKLLGRRIGYKALKTRLKQMWVRKGVINIIDLSNDYYLVAFSHEEDQYAALMDDPWFIYDHYLTVKEWSPKFHPASDTIKEVAVWLRISGLPIEYYDSKALHFIGNRIGKTIKVDKNTLAQERGKYARLCVQVNLTKPLLAMFTIKGRKYNIEYEGLHMLCTTCGRFGHYIEGCPMKTKISEGSSGGKEGEVGDVAKGQQSVGNNGEGPWRVVQKQRRSKKDSSGKSNAAAAITVVQGKINGGANVTGSRFASLMVDLTDLEKDGNNEEENLEVIEMEGGDNTGENQGGVSGGIPISKNKRIIGGGYSKKGDGFKLATRGGGSFKGRVGVNGKKGVDSIVEKVGVETFETLLSHTQRPNVNKPQQTGGISDTGNKIVSSNDGGNVGPKFMIFPNVTRPPDKENIPYSAPSQVIKNHVEDLAMQGEVFVDANDTSTNGNSDSEMEMVVETPTSIDM